MRVIVILASGASQRACDNKLAWMLPETKITLLDRAIATAQAVQDAKVFVAVSSAESPYARIAMNSGAQILYCPNAAQGMGCTIADAVRQVPLQAQICIFPGDMPWLSTQTLVALFEAAEQSPAEASASSQKRRAPACFGPRWHEALGALSGDVGARNLLAQIEDVVCVPVPELELRDVDRLEDLYFNGSDRAK